jgi:uncharacterized membrane protein
MTTALVLILIWLGSILLSRYNYNKLKGEGKVSEKAERSYHKGNKIITILLVIFVIVLGLLLVTKSLVT